ncbi:MAG: L-histidine N(alpha)-methyltransferase [Pseudomonadota bacterium]
MLDRSRRSDLLEILAGLQAPQKWIAPKWFYDKAGSALFERITDLPEYYLTRTETAILRRHAADLAALVPPGGALVEIGSGASVKTRLLLEAGAHFGSYVPIDISAAFLHDTADILRQRHPGLKIHPVVADFTVDLPLPAAMSGEPVIGFFPGSTIGNLDPDAAIDLLARARSWDGVAGFILGADLVKPVPELIAAYDDRAGVTAAFNLNVLSHLNAAFAADFDLRAFKHVARWCEDPARVEMHLVSRCDQSVRIGGQVIRFAAGESIHTESCRKYTAESLDALARAAGWKTERMLTDRDARFAVAVLRST